MLQTSHGLGLGAEAGQVGTSGMAAQKDHF
jgi:hypothetical protein